MAKRFGTTLSSIPEPLMLSSPALSARFTALTGALAHLLAAAQMADSKGAAGATASDLAAAIETVVMRCDPLLEATSADPRMHGVDILARMIRTVLVADDPTQVGMIRNILVMRHQTVLFTPLLSGSDRHKARMDAAFDDLAMYVAVTHPRASATLPPQAAVAHTAMTLRFISLMRAMDRSIQAERAIQRPVTGDVLAAHFTANMDRAEQALGDLTAATVAVLAEEMKRPEDRVLWEMGFLLKILLDLSGDGTRQRLFEIVMDYQQAFEAEGDHAVAQHVRRMQRGFFKLCAALLELEDFGGPGPDDLGVCAPELVA